MNSKFVINSYLLKKFINILKNQKSIDETLNLLKLLANQYGFYFSESGNNNFLCTVDCMPLINFYIDDDELVKYSLLDNVLIVE